MFSLSRDGPVSPFPPLLPLSTRRWSRVLLFQSSSPRCVSGSRPQVQGAKSSRETHDTLHTQSSPTVLHPSSPRHRCPTSLSRTLSLLTYRGSRDRGIYPSLQVPGVKATVVGSTKVLHLPCPDCIMVRSTRVDTHSFVGPGRDRGGGEGRGRWDRTMEERSRLSPTTVRPGRVTERRRFRRPVAGRGAESRTRTVSRPPCFSSPQSRCSVHSPSARLVRTVPLQSVLRGTTARERPVRVS